MRTNCDYMLEAVLTAVTTNTLTVTESDGTQHTGSISPAVAQIIWQFLERRVAVAVTKRPRSLKFNRVIVLA